MTDQEAFDTVTHHLLTQMEKSMLLGRCRYRGRAGLKCAVGCLIPDEDYSPMLEGKDIPTLQSLELFPMSLHGLKLELLVDLQLIHDGCEPEKWHGRLSEIAGKHGLNATALEGFTS